jgi:hypothetical protein
MLPNFRPWTPKWPACADVVFERIETPVQFRPLSVSQWNIGGVLTEPIPDFLKKVELLLRRQLVEVDSRSSHAVILSLRRACRKVGLTLR